MSDSPLSHVLDNTFLSTLFNTSEPESRKLFSFNLRITKENPHTPENEKYSVIEFQSLVKNFRNTVNSTSENIEFEPSHEKLYVKTFINNFRSVGFLDTGSDVSTMSLSIYEKLSRHGMGDVFKSKVQSIGSFSGNSVQTLGEIGRAHV